MLQWVYQSNLLTPAFLWMMHFPLFPDACLQKPRPPPLLFSCRFAAGVASPLRRPLEFLSLSRLSENFQYLSHYKGPQTPLPPQLPSNPK